MRGLLKLLTLAFGLYGSRLGIATQHGLLLLGILAITGCQRDPHTGDAARATASLKYWDGLNESNPDLWEVRAAVEGWTAANGGNAAEIARTDAILAILILEFTEANKAMANIPMDGVDPDLLAYAAKAAAFNARRIRLIGEAQETVRQIEALASPGQWAWDIFGSILRHAGDEEPVRGVVVDQLIDKAGVVGQTLSASEQLKAQLQLISTELSGLEADKFAIPGPLHSRNDPPFWLTSAYLLIPA